MHLDRPEKNKGTEGLPNRVARRQEAGHPGKGKELGFAGCWEGRQVRTGHLRKEFEVSLAGDVERLFPAQGYGGFWKTAPTAAQRMRTGKQVGQEQAGPPSRGQRHKTEEGARPGFRASQRWRHEEPVPGDGNTVRTLGIQVRSKKPWLRISRH